MLLSMTRWIEGKTDAWPIELKFLLSCMRSWMDGQSMALESFAGIELPWEAFISLAFRHRVFPLIYQSLKRQNAITVPAPILEQLKTACQANVFRMMCMTTEMERIVDRLQRESIPAIVLKGPVLGRKLYGDAMLRPSKDIDLLIAPDCLAKAHRLMLQSGYRCKTPFSDFSSPTLTRALIRTNHHFEYQGVEKPVLIELHWRLNSKYFLRYAKRRIDPQHCPAARIGSTPVRHLESVENLLYLCVHGAFHGWFRLRWLMDFALQLRETEPDAWSRVIREAQEEDVSHLLMPAVLLAHSLLGVSVPLSVERLLPSSGQRRLKSILKPALLLMSGSEAWGSGVDLFGKGWGIRKQNGIAFHRHFHLQMRYILGHFSPKMNDWETLRLPDAFFFLYFFLRPALCCYRKYQSTAGGRQPVRPE